MDPRLKLFVDEMKKAGMEKSPVDRIDGVEQSLGSRFEAVESVAASFDEWKPKMDAAVEDLQLEVGVLRKHVARVVLEREVPTSGLLTKDGAGAATPSAGNQSAGLDGHRVDSSRRGHELGRVFTHTHVPDNGRSCGTLRVPQARARTFGQIIAKECLSFTSSSFTQADRIPGNISAEEKRILDNNKSASLEERLAALRAYRKARGLCHRCAEN
ncbi:hypothetical protein ACP70R_035910 [Stipagrostis hirtigluma subsp. patula]